MEEDMVQKSDEIKEKRVKSITKLYYSRKDIQKAIFDFSQNREVVPRYFETFGKRPDTLQYPQDIFELVKKGATSFHCSQELWKDPLSLSTEMNQQQINELRTGWDLILDIDSKYFDYSKILAEIIIEILKFYNIENIGVKFSGSKGFHIIVPWIAFPKIINKIKVSDMFPEYPRIITQFIIEKSREKLIKEITNLTVIHSKYIKDIEAPKEVMPDLVLVSSRHLFRAPYSLHEKTGLSSIVLSERELKNFHPKDANPLKVKIRNFIPDSRKDEAYILLRESLDWYNSTSIKREQNTKADFSFEKKTLQITNLLEENFPPSIKEILKGLSDGKKRALFILLNFFRGLGLDKSDVEKRILEWNEKNNPRLSEKYIKLQISWTYKNKPVPPPNYEKEYYKGIGITPTEEEVRHKNPLNYMLKKYYKKEEQKEHKKGKRKESFFK
ncbi:MAG: hypothetical protein QXU40_01745 [Candidatus Pacearchaeota archaeon]